jgi:hypothetical protein
MLFLFKVRRHVCVCMRNKYLDKNLRARIRPWTFAGYACWVDRPDTT